jgi:DNA helicase-2/ATP-dependent DNA helicase PcrA
MVCHNINMSLVADFHVHSHFSRATSRDMTLGSLYRWAKIKGINLIGTGDFTHPAWFAEISEKLEPAETGLFRLKPEYASLEDQKLTPLLQHFEVRFILTSEISNIYTRHDRVRKMHNLLIAPSLSAVSRIIQRLTLIGNLKSDGRPILGLDSAGLLSICLESDPDIMFIPAHIWTPWFSLFGSKSGFDSIDEAFGDLSPHIFALETGLSSDPSMNWRLSALDRYTLISNSDAHSPSNLGREANLLDCGFSYPQIFQALHFNHPSFIGTIEFFPQEGKYHSDGHAKCHLRLSPPESQQHHRHCPACGKPLTLGVDHRVQDLADRPLPSTPPSP